MNSIETLFDVSVSQRGHLYEYVGRFANKEEALKIARALGASGLELTSIGEDKPVAFGNGFTVRLIIRPVLCAVIDGVAYQLEARLSQPVKMARDVAKTLVNDDLYTLLSEQFSKQMVSGKDKEQ